MHPTQHRHSALAIALVIAWTTALTGCVASARMRTGVIYSDPVVYVDTVPSYVYGQPVYYYRGYPAYWVDNRWYYRSASGWVVFQREPVALYQQRVRIHARPQTRVYTRPRGHVHVHPRGHVRPRGRVRAQPRGRAHADTPIDSRVRAQEKDDRRTRRD